MSSFPKESINKFISLFQQYLDSGIDLARVSEMYFQYCKQYLRPLEDKRVALTNKEAMIRTQLLSLFTVFDIYDTGEITPEDESLLKKDIKELIQNIKKNL